MKLKDLIKGNSWLSIELTFLKLYPQELKNIEDYREVFNYLQTAEVKRSNMVLVVQNVFDNYDKKYYAEVCGRKTNEQKNKKRLESYALEFTRWEKWLGMEVDKKTLNEFSELETISHCLYEMTFMGFDQRKIQKQLKKLEKQVEEIDNMTEEEKKRRFIPWEEVKKRLMSKKKK